MNLRALCCALLVASGSRAGAPLPPPLPPAPDEGAPAPPEDIPRRSHELQARGGVGALRCDGGAPATLEQVDPCASLGAARGLGVALLYRPWGHWALGLAAERETFAWGARGRLGEGQGEGRWTGVALEARWYPWSEGRWEPHVGYQAGLGWLAMRGEQGGVTIEREGLVMAGQLGLALWVSSRMKLGVEGEARWQATGAPEVCAGACLSVPLARLPDRSLGLAATLAVALGDEL